MNGVDQVVDELARVTLPTAERFAAMERDVFRHIQADTRARSIGRAGIAAAATFALLVGIMVGAIGPRPAEASVADTIALAPSTLLVGG